MRRLAFLFVACLILPACLAGLIGAWAPPAAAEKAELPPFIRGADVSMLAEIEAQGGRFYDGGEPKDALEILASRGVNFVRLRLFHDPAGRGGGNPDLERTARMAQRAKALGLGVLLNFHYSDWWADPGRQEKPAAWRDLDFDELEEAVHAYTREAVARLAAVGASPEIVQIGNEIEGGLLWPDGKTYGEGAGGFGRLARLLRAGIEGARDGSPGRPPLVMLHLSNGHDAGLFRWWFDSLLAAGVPLDFDIIGVSFYPFWAGPEGLEGLRANLASVSRRYGKDVMVVETAYAWTLKDADGHSNLFGPAEAAQGGYPVSVEGQAAAVRDVMEAVAAVPEGRGRGVFYWEPVWIPVAGAGWKRGEGNAWENLAMFDFEGNALPSLDVFSAELEPASP